MTDRTTPPVALRIGEAKLTEGTGGTHGHVSPVSGKVDATIPLAGAHEVDLAVTAAREAFAGWRRTPAPQRARVLSRLADLVEENTAEFCRLGALDNGTPVSLVPVALAADWIRYYAGYADKPHSEMTGSFTDGGELSYSLAQPYGVVGAIITWNAPLMSLSMKLPAALAAGNTVVVKPSELTPFSSQLFADLALQAGLPPGVLNVLPGCADAGVALIDHPGVDKISFTGGGKTATAILQRCAETFKPVVLELGGKSANIFLEDASLDMACMMGTFSAVGILSGQGCALPTRMLVHEAIYDDVLARVVGTAEGLVVGDPFAAETVSGPVVSAEAMERIIAVIRRAEADGAKLLTGGHQLRGEFPDGFFLAPTVFADVDPQSDLAQNEVFGPVLAVTKFSSDDEAIAIANGTRYGLSGYVQSANLKRALMIAEELVTGEVLINGALNANVRRPFGGIGASGYGKEGGRQGIEEFLRIKNIAVA
ncbi:aldehyde dehydrogenase family protein [Mycobacterium sp. 94-17]|uniref:aldehyde dehydrogenase family protein n=1 Tax=Mycobacterium sp. 94-17 TaxID=2986147 RepID=UPI002D1EF9B4|nr:aldehyde dehydrogenase family protein [Mycobacterium sp. 94-17]MEB4209710.1 aldehyde dehydrogenase family protein [Mycobacterium sp. 94-17]